jgi:catechol 2,3-dioxygenase-like lactoylglutathione lyase family enzyme
VTARRLQHVSMQVPVGLLEACGQFYETVLGMERIPNLAGALWLRFGDDDHVHLLAGPAMRTGGHLALEVDDLPDTVEAARSAGGDPYEAPRIWGEARWFFRDPAGNLIEVFEVSPPDADTIRSIAAERA